MRLLRVLLGVTLLLSVSCATSDKQSGNYQIDKADSKLGSNVQGPFFGPLPSEFFSKQVAGEKDANNRATDGLDNFLEEIVAKKLAQENDDRKITINVNGVYLESGVNLFSKILDQNIFLEPSLRYVRSKRILLEEMYPIEALIAFANINSLIVSKNGLTMIYNADTKLAKTDMIHITTEAKLKEMQKKFQSSIDFEKRLLESKKSLKSARLDLDNEEGLLLGKTFSYKFEYADPAKAIEYLRELYKPEAKNRLAISSEQDSNPETKSGPKRLLEYQYNIKFSLYNPENLVTVSAPLVMHEDILARIKEIDVKPRQVYIESRIVEIERSHIKDLGIELGGHYVKKINREFPHVIGIVSGGENPTGVSLPATTVASTGRGGQLGVQVSSVGGTIGLEANLTALEQAGHSKTLSNPKIIAINGSEAVIKAGREIPYQSSSANLGTSVQFKEAALSLIVTPLIMKDNRVRIKILAHKDEVDPILAVEGVPIIKKKELSTNVVVNDGESAALGGMFELLDASKENQIPWIHKIPLLGRLFQSNYNETRELELLIFITPTIIDQD